MDKKKRLAYLKEIDAHVGFHTGNGIAPQVVDLKKANDNDFVTNCNIRKVRNEDEQETYLRVNPNRNNNGYILIEYTAFKKVMKDVFEELAITDFKWKRVDMSFNTMEVIAELVAKLPEMEIDGVMSEDMEAMVWEKRMPDLTPAEQLAVEIDRFSHDYDIYSYRNNNPNMTESVSEISEMIVQGNTEPITDWLNEVISEGALPDEMQRAKVLLEKLAEYKPLAKIEEMEEQNYNMIDNVLNNGAEKAQREANKKDQEQPAVKASLKARLAEKRAQVSSHGQENEVQENKKNNQREM